VKLKDEVFWTQFLRRLRKRGLIGVVLVISDAHTGLKNAIRKTFSGAAWQRCRVHFMRNLLARVPKGHAEMVVATVRTIFASSDPPPPRRRINGAHPHHEPRSNRQGGEPTPATRRWLTPSGIAARFTFLQQTAGGDPLIDRWVVAELNADELVSGTKQTEPIEID
jgi:hypothetical protein